MVDPVLTQEEVEAIYAALQTDPSGSADIDELSLTSGRAFSQRAAADWNLATKAMIPIFSRIASGVLGRRTKIEVSEAVPVEEGLSPEIEPWSDRENFSLITVISLDNTRFIFGIDRTLARRYIERRTGAGHSAEESSDEADEKELTLLEKRLVTPMLDMLGQMFAEASPIKKPKIEIIDEEPSWIWKNRRAREQWMETSLVVAGTNGAGLWLMGPVTTFLPPMGDIPKAISHHINNARVEVSVQLGTFKLTAAELWQLQPGSLHTLPTSIGDSLQVSIGGVKKLFGEPLVSRGNIAVRIMDGEQEDRNEQ